MTPYPQAPEKKITEQGWERMQEPKAGTTSAQQCFLEMKVELESSAHGACG